MTSIITNVEVFLMEDGTYVVQQTSSQSGYDRRVDRTLTEVESIPAGLRALADRIEQEALAEFRRT